MAIIYPHIFLEPHNLIKPIFNESKPEKRYLILPWKLASTASSEQGFFFFYWCILLFTIGIRLIRSIFHLTSIQAF